MVMGQRKYLSDAPEIGIEPDDLAFFRFVASMLNRPLADVCDKALSLGASQMRSDLAPTVAAFVQGSRN
jgi:hypothetical protein